MKTFVSILCAVLPASTLMLAGCHRKPPAPTVGPAYSQGIVVSQGRLVLPAVKGHPGAAYFTVDNENNAPATLLRVDVTGAHLAEMHQTSGGTMAPLAQLRIDPGQRAIFAPAGKHVMVFNLVPTLAPGGTSRIVLHFQDGRTASTPLRIEAAGGDMAAMDMGGKP